MGGVVDVVDAVPGLVRHGGRRGSGGQESAGCGMVQSANKGRPRRAVLRGAGGLYEMGNQDTYRGRFSLRRLVSLTFSLIFFFSSSSTGPCPAATTR